jgi:glycosyltransferase involved in cell wall biosynthesis
MRIGIISTVGDCSWAGSEEMWKLFATEALQRGHSVAAMLQTPIAQSQELAEFRALGGVVFAYNPLNRYTSRIVSRGLYSRFRPLKRWQPEIVCISGHPAIPYRDRDIYSLLNAHTGARIFIIQGNADWFISGQAERDALRTLYRSARRIICVSRDNAELLQRQLTSSLRITILPNPIRTRLDHPLPWPGDSEKVRFATVGRYEVFGKCHDSVLQALATPEWKTRNWRLDLFGNGSDAKYIQDVIRYFGLEDRVRLCGYEREFIKVWTDHHLHILISRAEGLALALIESMFCGRPAVVTRTGGNYELLRDNKDGFVSYGSNPETIRETLERAWNNRQRWPEMGEAAFQRVNEWVPSDLSVRLFQTICDPSSPEANPHLAV